MTKFKISQKKSKIYDGDEINYFLLIIIYSFIEKNRKYKGEIKLNR